MAPGIRNDEFAGTNRILNIGPEEDHTAVNYDNNNK